MLDAAKDRELTKALDRPPKVDKLAAIKELASRQQDRTWIASFLAAMRGPGKLSSDEFYYYGLDRPGITPEKASAYVGKTVQRKMHFTCNDRLWYAPSHDKALFYTILSGSDLPAPETVAFLAPRPRPGFRHLDISPAGLRQALEHTPLFAKPVAGIYSIGTLVLEEMDNDAAHIRGHGAVPIETLIDYMRGVSPQGYLLQRVLHGHPDLNHVTDGTVPSLRLLVIASEVPKIISAALKLPARSNVADNFWRAGNILAAADQSGTTVRGHRERW